VHLTGTVSNRDAVGARVRVVLSDDEDDDEDKDDDEGERRTIYREVTGGSNFSADGPREIHFGLGKAESVEEVEVSWPSGIRTVLTGLSANERLELTESTLFSSTFNDGKRRAGRRSPETGPSRMTSIASSRTRTPSRSTRRRPAPTSRSSASSPTVPGKV
jgi:hypothetical protein